MPIKIPKAFPRRRSSGNELEERPNPPESSFRVLERPAAKSFDGGQAFKRLSHGRPLSAGNLIDGHLVESADQNRGSGATDRSASSGGHDNSSASARYSSSSTVPSSTDAHLEEKPLPPPKNFFNMPAPSVPESTAKSFKIASRGFSFGRKKGDAAAPDASSSSRPSMAQSHSDGFTPQTTRGRAMTDNSFASGSTATPPRLLETGLELGKSDQDGFGSMFENFGKGNSQVDLTQSGAEASITPGGSRTVSGERAAMTPAPLNLDRSREAGAAPMTLNSQSSQDALLASSSPMERTFSYEDDLPLSVAQRGLPKSQTMPLAGSAGPPPRSRQPRPPSDGLRRSSAYAMKRNTGGESPSMQDEDARLVMDSISASRKLDRYSSGAYSDDDDNPAAALVSRSANSSPYGMYGVSKGQDSRQRSPKPLYESPYENASAGWRQGSANATPRAQSAVMAAQEDQSLFDASPDFTPVAPRNMPQRPKIQPPAKPQTQNKIMTPAEFEKYRREQELKSTADPRVKHESSDEEGDDYEDDDELERSRQAARQRRKQEAHMSVYRQQMMKVTGEQPSDLPSFRPNNDKASMSTPNLRTTTSIPEINFDTPVEAEKVSDDEDEDVPLGVLAAHGFPSKNRPPTAASNHGNNIQYKSESYPPPPPASTAGGSQGGRGAGLPPFARNLPADPYYGASIVNQSNRENLSHGQGGPGSTHGSTPPGLHPAGLVGVINAEEHARAARRGSPNPQGNFGSPLPGGMGSLPGMPAPMTPGEQAQAQATEQMTRMMQFQMQWMEQMQQMQQMWASGMMPPGQPPPMMMPNFPQQPPMMPMNPGMPQQHPGHMARPSSTGSHPLPNAPRPGQARAMSMTGLAPSQTWHPHGGNRQSVAPSMMSGGLGQSGGQGYTSSIAPSERSNVGMPSRYRPVSIAPTDEQQMLRPGSRTSTFTEGMLQPQGLGAGARHSRLSNSGDRSQSRLSSLRPVSTTPPKKPASDDDDEEGWEEMKKKRDKKKSMWRLHRKKEEPEAQFDVYDYPQED